MQRQIVGTRPGPILAVGVLIAVAVAGLGARADAPFSTTGPLRHAGTGVLVAGSAALAVAASAFVRTVLTSLRCRRGKDDVPPHVWEPPGTSWGRGLAVLFALAVVAAPWVVAVWWTRQPATRQPAGHTATPPAAPATVPETSAGQPDGGSGWAPWLLLAVAALIVAGWVLARRHRRAPHAATVPPQQTGLASAV
ncbi:MAG: hypothetical protein GEV28_35135 [Actinophytocola sp.]|uniref:hypothetical protein n=1 Tax=Actinophytocola sp. TaxID=1872138 RepID=UPI0013298E46|nr:hypothetical protein [Actinophytocola sp.]MPZ85341.1 hypothetical protein [Actinophytocola sp.]